MTIYDSINANLKDITWFCISASTMMVGSIAVQFDSSDEGVVLSVEKMGDGGAFESTEKQYSSVTIKKIIEILKNPDISSIVKEDEDDSTFRFEDDSDCDGWEYNISCGNDDEIFFSLSGSDYYCKSLQTLINELMSVFTEVNELDNFINDDYFDDEDEEAEED